MAIRSGMFNSVNGDRKVDAAFFSLFFSTFIGDGVFPNPSTGLQIVEGQGMQTIVKPGKGWIQGRFVINDSDHIFKHDIADGVLKRIDRVVMRLNHLTRQIEIVLKKGSQASSPTAPTIQRDAEAYELVLADVLINAGTTQITQGNITDQRLNKSLCGIVHGVVDQVDTTTIFNQYQSWFNQYSNGKALEFQEWQTRVTSELEAWIQAEELDFTAWKQDQELTFTQWSDGRKDAFDVWFATIRGILDEEAAGNIMNVINDHKDSPVPHKYYDEGLAQPMLYGLKRNAELDTPAFVYGATEAGPHEVINLPNYEQVEGVKTTLTAAMEATGGKVAGSDGKMYKANMIEYLDFVTGEGRNYWQPIIDDYESKFPELAVTTSGLAIVGSSQRSRLWDNIWFIAANKTIVFVDMSTYTVLHADVIPANYTVQGWNRVENGWFVDDKYLYIRCIYATTTPFMVFDKKTFKVVTAIPQLAGGSGSIPYSENISGNFVCIGSIFFAAMSSTNQMFAFKIIYNGSGVPSSYMFANSYSTAAGATWARCIWGDGIHVYVLTTENAQASTIEKIKFDPTTYNWTVIAKKQNSMATAGQGQARWYYQYSVNGVNYILIQFGANADSSVIHVFNVDTITHAQQLQTGQYWEFPTFDYQTGTRFITQPRNTTWYEIDGSFYDYYLDWYLDGMTWKNKIKTIPGLKSHGGTTLTRLTFMTYWSWIKDGELYMRLRDVMATKIIPIKMIQGYVEVKE